MLTRGNCRKEHVRMKNKAAIDDLVRETVNKVREGRISREEGR